MDFQNDMNECVSNSTKWKLAITLCVWITFTGTTIAANNVNKHDNQNTKTQQTQQVKQDLKSREQKIENSLEEAGARQVAMFNKINTVVSEWWPFGLVGVITLIIGKELFKRKAFQPRKIETGTNSHGSARFVYRAEIKHLLRNKKAVPEVGEILIGRYKEKWLVHKNFYLKRNLANRHILILGPSGSGKSRSIFLPNCELMRGSFMATDPKSELWDYTSGRQTNAIRFAPREPDQSQGFNFVAACKDITVAKRVVSAIVYAEGVEKGDKFWTNGERQLLTAAIVHVANSDVPTPTHLYELLCLDGETLVDILSNSRSETSVRLSRSFRTLDSKIATTIAQAVIGKLQWLEDPNVRRFTSSTRETFDFSILRQKPTQIYWCLSEDDVVELQALTSVFFNLALVTLKRIKDGIGVTLFFDEFANIGKLIGFEKDITLLRGKDIAVVAGLQSISQLETNYGISESKTIFANFGNKVILNGLEKNTAEEISQLMGDYTYAEIRESRSRGGRGFFDGKQTVNENYAPHARRLLTATEIRTYDDNKLLLISTSLPVVSLERVIYDKALAPAKVTGCGKEIKVKYKQRKSSEEKSNKNLPPLPDFPDMPDELGI